MYAIIVTGGKQYKVEAGDTLYIEKLDVEADSEVVFDKVIAVGKEDGIVVFTYKPKKNEKRKMGHRQPYTKVEISAINA